MKTVAKFRMRCLSVLSFTILTGVPLVQSQYRKEIRIPDIPGYKTLKCDFHIHTVFSDGNVWPTIRVREAWASGLDAIAITDHLENQVHDKDIKADRNRSFEIVKDGGKSLGLIVIKGAEITKNMPPGHLNAIFIQDAETLNQTDWRIAVKTAVDQGAFVFWNHPGWNGQQPDGIARWYDEQTEMLNKGWLKGIEIVNDHEYYPQVQRWCLEKKLAMIGNSDAHDPILMSYDAAEGEKRPITLVFAKERTEDAIQEALLSRRTAVCWNGDLFGETSYLKPLFENAVQIQNRSLVLKGRNREYIPITNTSDVDFHLMLDGQVEGLNIPADLVLKNNRTVLFEVRAPRNQMTGQKTFPLPYRIANLRTTPEEGLPFVLELKVEFVK